MPCGLRAVSIPIRAGQPSENTTASQPARTEHTTRSTSTSGDFELVINLSGSHFDFAAPRLGLRLALVLADIVTSGLSRASVDPAPLVELPLQFLNHSFHQLNRKDKSDAIRLGVRTHLVGCRVMPPPTALRLRPIVPVV